MTRRSRLTCRPLEDRTVPATFFVTSLADSGPNTLRQAITNANNAAGADTVFCQPPGIGLITLTSGELAISDDVAIVGNSSVVSGNKASRVFNTNPAPAGAKILFQTLTIANGKSSGNGGGILAGDEAVTLLACTLTGNSSLAGDGGGMAVLAGTGTLTLIGCTVTGNQSVGGGGGGIYLGDDALATITSCAITGNTAKLEGGGIHSNGGSLTVSNSTLSGNTAKTGGGLDFRSFSADGLILRNSTLSGNMATDGGGAVGLYSAAGTMTVQNCTITANQAGGLGGGGIGRLTGGAGISVESTVIAGNTHTVGGNEDLFTTGVVNAKFSAIGTTVGVTTFNGDATTLSLVGDNLKLGPLGANGGTQSHVPAPDSPLINVGSNPAALTTDQRGSAAARNSNGGVDIGAVELQRFLVTNTNDKGTGSLRIAVINANTFGGSDTISFDAAVFATLQTIKLTTGELTLADAVTVDGPAARVRIDGNAAGRIFNADGTAPTGAAITLNNLHLTNGNSADHGAAIIASGIALTLKNCFVTDCIAASSGGGALSMPAGNSLLIEDCTFDANVATGSGDGGAVLVADGASVVVRRTTFSGNSAGSSGGAIATLSSLVVEDSTFVGNSASFVGAEAGGGAILQITALPEQALFTNCTFSDNTAPNGVGGAVHLRRATPSGPAIAAIFRNCTMSSNSAGIGGGGIGNSVSPPLLTLTSTIVAQNASAGSPDILLVAQANITCNDSIVGIADAGNFTLIGSGNQTGSKVAPLNPLLGPLNDNGGPTLTRRLLNGSPALNSGNNSAGLSTDQRGFPRVVGGSADVGAFEAPPPPRVTNVIVNNGAAQRSRVTRVQVEFDQIVSVALGFGVVRLKRQVDNAPVAIGAVTFDSNGPVTIVSVFAFLGAVTDAGSLADGRYTLTVVAANVSGANGTLDGNGDGIAGDDFVLVGDLTNKLFRLFGDNDGDGDVDAQDFGAFRAAFGGTSNLAFDFDNDGDVDAADFGQFRVRFGAAV